MSSLELRCDNLLVACDVEAGRLTFDRSGKRLPWEIDLGRTTHVTMRGKSSGAGESSACVSLPDLTLRRLSASHLQWVGEVGGAGLALEVELTADGLIFSVSPLGTGETEVISARWPGELCFRGDSREVCWSDNRQGVLFRADAKPWSTKIDWRHTTCRFYGFTCDDESLTVIVDTPFDAEAALSDDGTTEMKSSLEFGPSLGALSYPRRVRFLALEDSGYVAVANAFREYAQKHGLWKSFEERVDENPNVAKLKGAFVACAGYWHDEDADQVATMKAMREYGFEQGYLFSPKLLKFGTGWEVFGVKANRMTDDQLREIQQLGYLCSPFLQVEEASPSIGPEKFAIDSSGEKIQRWQTGEAIFHEIAKWRVPAMLPVFDDLLQVADAIHFDTLTAMRLVENYGERPYDCAGDVRLRMEIADYYRRLGKVICGESMRDWGIRHVDMSTAKTFVPVNDKDPRVWTVPLSDLVYHDSTIRTHWEHHAYDDDSCVRTLAWKKYHPFGMEMNDLLTCSPPVLFPEGMMYKFELNPITLSDGRPEVKADRTKATLYRKRMSDPETQAALPKALRVCRLNQRHGTARMLTHRFLDPASPMVQESQFETGLSVTVNFSDEHYQLPDGRTVDARSALVED